MVNSLVDTGTVEIKALRCDVTEKSSSSSLRLTLVPLLCRWHHHYRHNGNWTDSGGQYYTRVVQDSATSLLADPTTLHLSNLTAEDSGYYSCYFTTLQGQAVSSGWVEVRLPLAAAASPGTLAAVAAALAALGLAAVTLVLGLKFRRERREKLEAVESARTVVLWTRKVIVERMADAAAVEVRVERVRVEVEAREVGEVDTEDLLTFEQDPVWEVPRQLLLLQEELGSGAFGRVVRALVPEGRWCGAGMAVSGGQGLMVAVKMLKQEHTEAEVVAMVKEIEIMKAVGRHENIVNLLGVCSLPAGAPLLVVLELAEQVGLVLVMSLVCWCFWC